MSELPQKIHQSVIGLLLYSKDDEKARLVKNYLPLEVWAADRGVFDLMSSVYGYIDSYSVTPKLHILDLIESMKLKEEQRSNLINLAQSCYDRLSNCNIDYLLDQISAFHRKTIWEQSLPKFVQYVQNGQIDNLEAEISRCQRQKIESFNPGSDLLQIANSMIKDAESGNTDDHFKIRIPAFDLRQIYPKRGTLFTLLAPEKSGKSHFMVYMGKQAILQEFKTVHVSLELSEKEVGQRYIQSMLGMSKFPQDPQRVLYSINSGKVDYIPAPQVKGVLQDLNDLLDVPGQLQGMQYATDKLRIKEYPSGTLTCEGLESYLDSLEMIGFDVDVLLIDYPRLMKIRNLPNLRVELGQIGVDIRRICQERGIMGVVVAQTSRTGKWSSEVLVSMISEDFELIRTSDNVITFSQTHQEYRMGIARLGAGAIRNADQDFQVLITQDLATSQFVTSSVELKDHWGGSLKEAKKMKFGDEYKEE